MLKRKQIQFTSRQAQAIHREAIRRGVSDSAVLRELAETLIVGTGRKGEAARRERALGIVGRFHSGRRDTSTEHDRQLADAFRE